MLLFARACLLEAAHHAAEHDRDDTRESEALRRIVRREREGEGEGALHKE